ncbi:hypothetical protein ACHAXA_010969 [Cyclostephanos tholiformis]|uniref:Uncharacterized protein n=1 Tax=Cyclostephanos tholiformis TaxID=382380 RepID=A0ABD3RZT0_9STRA
MEEQNIISRTSGNGGDAYARCRTGSTAGRGSIAGWTRCPLCSSSLQSIADVSVDTHKLPEKPAWKISTKSVKLFSHGRGLSAHLHAVHTPWNPGKAELRRRQALHKRIENDRNRHKRNKKRPKLAHGGDIDHYGSQDDVKKGTWEPSDDDIKQWNRRVMEIVALVESEAKKGAGLCKDEDETSINESKGKELKSNSCKKCVDDDADTERRDRSGKVCHAYRESIPPFLAAAADGDLDALRKFINDVSSGANMICANSEELDSQSLDLNRREHVKSLLSLRDRNGSTAEHWAAGGGHLDCVAYLLNLRDGVMHTDVSDIAQHADKKVRRRRDGKTSLHYAARNGHNNIIDLLLAQHDAPPVDVRSGDGTTPLHMACYGGHPSTVKHLVETHHADVFAVNEWDCGVAHWAAMSLGKEGKENVIELCEFLKDNGVDFLMRQKQGHTPLHKAAARRNSHVIEWLANPSTFSVEARKSMGVMDVGGNLPSDILQSVNGENEFILWMKDQGW